MVAYTQFPPLHILNGGLDFTQAELSGGCLLGFGSRLAVVVVAATPRLGRDFENFCFQCSRPTSEVNEGYIRAKRGV